MEEPAFILMKMYYLPEIKFIAKVVVTGLCGWGTNTNEQAR